MNSTTPFSAPRTELRSRIRFNPPIRARMLGVLIISAFLTIVVVAYFSIQAVRSELIGELGGNLEERAKARTTSLINQIQYEIIQPLNVLSANDLLQDPLEEVLQGDPVTVQAQIQASEAQWSSAADSDPLVQGVLNSTLSIELQEYLETFSNNAEIFITDQYGGLVAATSRTSDFYQADEAWWQQAYNDGVGQIYIGQPELDESTQTLGVIAAVPVFGEGEFQGQVVGVLRTTFRLAHISEIVSEFRLGDTGTADVVFPDGMMVSGRAGFVEADAQVQGVVADGLRLTAFQGILEGRESLISVVPIADVAEDDYIDRLGWTLVVHQDLSESLAPIDTAVRSVIITGAIALLGSSVFAVVATSVIIRPVNRLARTTRALASGDFKVRADVMTNDEIGHLSSDINAMADQIQGLISTLETRISARTRDLEAVAEVNKQISTILNVERLLEDVADITKERFKLYHAHIYLVNEDGNKLLLAAGAGHVGRQMVLIGHAINLSNLRSLVARAARSRSVVTANDVMENPDFLPNPMLPDTKSELAVALVARGQLIGVLDVQSDEVGTFDEDLKNVIELLSGQIAVALSNARLFEQTERSSRHERALGTIDRRMQDAVDMDEILQTAVRELGKALRVPHTAMELRIPSDDVQTGEFVPADSSAD